MPAEKDNDDTAHSFAKGQLKAIIERIEKLEEEKKAISDDIKDVYGEAKGNGFDVKALRTIIRMRKQDADERQSRKPSWKPTCRRSACCAARPPCGSLDEISGLTPGDRSRSGRYRPVKAGARFSRKCFTPSLKSSLFRLSAIS
jgi:uncharacterized protein (UPF0335 family)